jgi:hypothetical protein
MSCVRDERALPLIGFGQPVKHFVQGDSKSPDLVRRRRDWQSLPSGRPTDPARSADLLRACAKLFHRP